MFQELALTENSGFGANSLHLRLWLQSALARDATPQRPPGVTS
jgi:hypothetical protein